MWAYQVVSSSHFERRAVPACSAFPGPGQVVVRTLAGGICGTDVPYFKGGGHPGTGGPGLPLAPGRPLHEIAGVVIATGAPGISVGDHVVGWASGADALAYEVETNADGLVGYNEAMSPEHAVMLQPLACVLFAVEQISKVNGARVAIIGLGPIGLLFAHVLRSHGAAHVTGIDLVDRRDVSAWYGVDEFVHSSSGRWAAVDRPLPPDLVIEAAGHQSGTLNDAVRAVRPGGEIYYFGMPDDDGYVFDLRRFLRKNLVLRAGLTLDRREMLTLAAAYVEHHPDLPGRYVTDVVPVERAEEAYARAAHPRSGQAKVVLTFADPG
jgi:L-iditol 2-dehydrogenase